MGSDGGGGSPFDWWRVLELLIPALVSVGLAWLLFRAERKAAQKDRMVQVYEQTYTRIMNAIRDVAEHLIKGRALYAQGGDGRALVASSTDSLREAYGLAIAIKSPRESDIKWVMDGVLEFLDRVPMDEDPFDNADWRYYLLGEVAKGAKDTELGILRHLASNEIVREVEKRSVAAQATKDNDKSSADDNDAKSSS